MSRRVNHIADDSVKATHTTPEKRLLASVLQRAMVDMLSMFGRDAIIAEVDSGIYDQSDREIADKYLVDGRKPMGPRIPRGERKLRDGGNEREARDLIRWFRSESREPFSFIYILIALGMDDIQEEILNIMENDTIEDRPNLQRAI